MDYAYVYTNIHTYIHTSKSGAKWTCTYIHMHIHTYTHTYTQVAENSKYIPARPVQNGRATFTGLWSKFVAAQSAYLQFKLIGVPVTASTTPFVMLDGPMETLPYDTFMNIEPSRCACAARAGLDVVPLDNVVVSVCVCVCVWMYVCVARACVFVCVRERERGRGDVCVCVYKY